MLYQDMGQPGKALPLALEALRLRREALEKGHPDCTRSHLGPGVRGERRADDGAGIAEFSCADVCPVWRKA
jgi:hypothetical protein